jgi:outer membrane lipase/esterase
MTSFTARAAALAKLWLFSFVVGIGLLAAGHASAEGPFSRIVVFGDSLSDSGNLFAITGNPGTLENNWGMDTPEELVTLIPGQAYISQRLSNGPTWVELLGTALGLGVNVKPVFGDLSDLQRFNFAVAGATAANLGGLPNVDPFRLFHLNGQVSAFGDRASHVDHTLYVIAIGGNDVRAALQAVLQSQNPDVGAAILGQTLVAVEEAIRALHDQGGTRFLIWNIPDVGATPAFHRLENGVDFPDPFPDPAPIPGIAELATRLIAGNAPKRNGGYNALLKARLQTLSAQLPGVEFIHFDAFKELSDVRKHPRRYGLTNVEDPCIQVQPFFTLPGTCAQPDRHLFWDGIHPTRAGHAIIAFLVGKALVEALQDH